MSSIKPYRLSRAQSLGRSPVWHVEHCAKVMEGRLMAVEFRNKSWWTENNRESTLAFERERGLVNVVVDGPQASAAACRPCGRRPLQSLPSSECTDATRPAGRRKDLGLRRTDSTTITRTKSCRKSPSASVCYRARCRWCTRCSTTTIRTRDSAMRARWRPFCSSCGAAPEIPSAGPLITYLGKPVRVHASRSPRHTLGRRTIAPRAVVRRSCGSVRSAGV
jgi:hypothetical protein